MYTKLSGCEKKRQKSCSRWVENRELTEMPREKENVVK
jgi:hypothetical protein